MSSSMANMIKSFRQQGYMQFWCPSMDMVEAESRDLISHDSGIVVGPDGEMVPFQDLLSAGTYIDSRYHEGAAELLGKIVAHRTQGRFPERWVGVSTGDPHIDRATISRIGSYVVTTFDHLLDPDDIAVLENDALCAKADLLRTADILAKCLREIGKSKDHPNLNLWKLNVQSVVENLKRGVHVARLNRKLLYDNGSALAFLANAAPDASVYIGTRHGIPFSDIRKGLEMGTPLEEYLNLVSAKEGTWFRVLQGQPFKATPGILAELVMRDGQRSAKLRDNNVYMALTDEAVVGPERVKKQIVGPKGPVEKSSRTWSMKLGKLSLRGVEFVDKDAEPIQHKPEDNYRHVRSMDGAVRLIIGDGNVELQAGESALVLPGAAFMVGAVGESIPSTYVVSTLTGLMPNQTV